MRAPDFAEPINGWRAWRVAETRHGLRLWSVIYDEPWEPRSPFAATCRDGHAHAAPAAECECGVYASRSSLAAARYLLGRNDPAIVHRVVGLVSLWGSVFEGVGGWRAALGYPRQLWVPAGPGAAEVARRLEAYGVPVVETAVRCPVDVAAALDGELRLAS